MNFLYFGKYKRRFVPVTEHIRTLAPGSSVLELCFGDTYLAEYCKANGYRWTGLDINDHFVKAACNMGFDAYNLDVEKTGALPHADLCVIMGSLYHFHPDTGNILRKMFNASQNVVISEPISNFSSKAGLIGFLAKRAANAGKGDEKFRYNRRSFLTMIARNSEPLKYRITTIQDCGKDIIVKLLRK